MNFGPSKLDPPTPLELAHHALLLRAKANLPGLLASQFHNARPVNDYIHAHRDEIDAEIEALTDQSATWAMRTKMAIGEAFAEEIATPDFPEVTATVGALVQLSSDDEDISDLVEVADLSMSLWLAEWDLSFLQPSVLAGPPVDSVVDIVYTLVEHTVIVDVFPRGLPLCRLLHRLAALTRAGANPIVAVVEDPEHFTALAPEWDVVLLPAIAPEDEHAEDFNFDLGRIAAAANAVTLHRSLEGVITQGLKAQDNQ